MDRERAGPLMTLMIECLPDCPALVFSRSGEVLLQTGPAIALFGPVAGRRLTGLTGITHPHRLRRYRHPELGELELYRQVLVDPMELQVLLVFAAVPGSPTDEKIRRRTAAGH